MTTLTIQNTLIKGTGDLTFVSANAGGDDMPNDGRTHLVFVNGSGGDITVTFVTTKTEGGLTIEDPAFVVGAGETAITSKFAANVYNNVGVLSWTYSDVTSLTVAAFR